MSDVQLGVIETKIPSRLDRLPWSRFHWRIVLGLGTAWVLDGLEVTIVGSVASRLTEHGSGISISATGIGVAAALYVVGACSGALVFGHLTDRFGRKKLFLITLGLYMVATAVTAVSFSAWFFFLFRFLTGAGIGGEYAAINSAIDELIPARARGRIDLVINGSYWIGSILGSALALLFLDESIFPADIGWRLTFVLGLILASAVMVVRRHVPESPRWLFIHGREEEAEAIVDAIESDVQEHTDAPLAPVRRTLTVRQRRAIGFRSIVRTAIKEYPTRSILCVALFVGQAFIYNGITFNLGTMMTKFFHVASGTTPVFLILYAAANFVGPLVLGRLFDTVGRIPMISGTYIGSAVLGLLLAGLFVETGLFDAWTFIAVVMATFLLASAGASAAYLTSSEIFPMETRALSIAFFYAIGTAVGGIAGPLLFGPLISTGSKGLVGLAFVIGAVLMAAGGLTELVFGVKAEQAQLEDIAKPLTAEEGEGGEGGEEGEEGEGAETAPVQLAASAHRARAAEHRAAAAEHRARFHEILAGTARGGPKVDEQLELEDTLAQVSDARALAEDERTAAAEARAELQRAAAAAHPGDRAGDGTLHPVRAAELRARSHDEEAQALLSADDAESERHRRLADAALERARSAEQLALASEARRHGDGGAVHEAWAEMHQHRAEAIEHEVSGRADVAAGHGRRADQAAERARALSLWQEAAEHRARAAAEHEEHDARMVASSGSGTGDATGLVARERREAQRRAEASADGERIRERLNRRDRRELSGMRRYRPGPGRLGRAFGPTASPPLAEEALDHEIVAIERALHDHGATDRRELARLVGARYWGPGVFNEALRQAVADGAVRRLSRRVYAPASDVEQAPAAETGGSAAPSVDRTDGARADGTEDAGR